MTTSDGQTVREQAARRYDAASGAETDPESIAGIESLALMLDELADDAERAHRAGETIPFRDLINEYRSDLRSDIEQRSMD